MLAQATRNAAWVAQAKGPAARPGPPALQQGAVLARSTPSRVVQATGSAARPQRSSRGLAVRAFKAADARGSEQVQAQKGAAPIPVPGPAPPGPAALPGPARIGSLRMLARLWGMTEAEDRRTLVLCVSATCLSTVAYVGVAPALGAVVDIISAPSSTTSSLLAGVGRLCAVFAAANATLALQVLLSRSLGEALAR